MWIRTVLILTLTPLLLPAQGRFRAERPWREGPALRTAPRRDRILARLHEIRSRKLQQALGLPSDKANNIADRWGQYDEEAFARRQQIQGLRQQMNGTLLGPGSEQDKNRAVQPLVEQLTHLQQQQEESRKQFQDDLRGSLTPTQQARFLMLMEDFKRSLQEAIQERRGDR
jgi:hypothetical protein